MKYMIFTGNGPTIKVDDASNAIQTAMTNTGASLDSRQWQTYLGTLQAGGTVTIEGDNGSVSIVPIPSTQTNFEGRNAKDMTFAEIWEKNTRDLRRNWYFSVPVGLYLFYELFIK